MNSIISLTNFVQKSKNSQTIPKQKISCLPEFSLIGICIQGFIILIVWVLLLSQHAFAFALMIMSGFVLTAFGIAVVWKISKALFYGYAYGSIVFFILIVYHILIILGVTFVNDSVKARQLFIGNIAVNPSSIFKLIYISAYAILLLTNISCICMLFSLVHHDKPYAKDRVMMSDLQNFKDGNNLNLSRIVSKSSSPIRNSNSANRQINNYYNSPRNLPENLYDEENKEEEIKIVFDDCGRPGANSRSRIPQESRIIKEPNLPIENNGETGSTIFSRGSFASYVRKVQKYADGELSELGMRRRTPKSLTSPLILKRKTSQKTCQSLTSSFYDQSISGRASKSSYSSFATLWRTLYSDELSNGYDGALLDDTSPVLPLSSRSSSLISPRKEEETPPVPAVPSLYLDKSFSVNISKDPGIAPKVYEEPRRPSPVATIGETIWFPKTRRHSMTPSLSPLGFDSIGEHRIRMDRRSNSISQVEGSVTSQYDEEEERTTSFYLVPKARSSRYASWHTTSQRSFKLLVETKTPSKVLPALPRPTHPPPPPPPPECDTDKEEIVKSHLYSRPSLIKHIHTWRSNLCKATQPPSPRWAPSDAIHSRISLNQKFIENVDDPPIPIFIHRQH